MSELPIVACVMLTKDRPDFARHAVECFRAQTYSADKRMLLMYDTGNDAGWYKEQMNESTADIEAHILARPEVLETGPIGTLRNYANAWAGTGVLQSFPSADIILHWDDDDFYAPARIQDQVNRLLTTGKSVTGYHSIHFYEPSTGKWWWYEGAPQFGIGASLCYRREWWERHKFQRLNVMEDRYFVDDSVIAGQYVSTSGEGMMYATVHPGNTSPRSTSGGNWKPRGDCRQLFPSAFDTATA